MASRYGAIPHIVERERDPRPYVSGQNLSPPRSVWHVVPATSPCEFSRNLKRRWRTIPHSNFAAHSIIRLNRRPHAQNTAFGPGRWPTLPTVGILVRGPNPTAVASIEAKRSNAPTRPRNASEYERTRASGPKNTCHRNACRFT